MKYFGFILFVVITQHCFAQEDSPYIKKAFVIVQSTKDYTAAKLTAQKAAKGLSQKLDLRELKPNKETGLTFSNSICENEGGYPCYIARGRYDDGSYVSIEWSDAFDKFTEGFYIVIVYSGNKEEANTVLQKAKKIFKDAYYKQAQVYVGCMH